jgi:glycosyltransferase involved in cell wall biosynthesis
MRILFANDGVADAGGVQTYLEAVMSGLAARGHELSFLHCERDANKTISRELAALPHFSVETGGLESVINEIKLWSPDVCFSHNMSRLDVERRLLEELPVVKFMHGYFGTCIGGQKSLFFPKPEPCHRRFGKACLALYLPRRCGQLNLGKMLEGYEWARKQNALFRDYRAIVVASEHMKREYVFNGADASKVFVNTLFSVHAFSDEEMLSEPAAHRVLFLGRMTKLKGGDILIRAVAEAARRLKIEISLTMAGDGPQRAAWERLASQLKVKASFPGWVTGEEHARLFKEASLLAVPSIWPEPFGLVGLEAASFGLPAIAFDVGGISEWLRDGVNGYLVKRRAPNWTALAEGLVKVLGQPEHLASMRRAARKAALELSLGKHLDRLEEIFDSVRAGRV